MKRYLVGGAVRNKLLGFESGDRDWVVVGSCREELLNQGYKQVGNSFPVFLHPTTFEEHALARLESKTAKGHQGFEFEVNSQVTLPEDLMRRDLTINAIAYDDESQQIIDPYNGKADIKRRILKHVSPAFSEDPLRVLRVARFAAQFSQYSFTVAPKTLRLMQQVVKSGELKNLSIERIVQETTKALLSPKPSVYFYILSQCNALKELFPEIAALQGVIQKPFWHPEIDCFVHTMLALDYAANQKPNIEVLWCTLLHDLGKAITPKNILPSHTEHERRGLALVEKFAERLQLSNKIKKYSSRITKLHLNYPRAFELKLTTIIKLFDKLDCWRDSEILNVFLKTCEADACGRYTHVKYPCLQTSYYLHHLKFQLTLDNKKIISNVIEVNKIKQSIARERLRLAHQAKLNWDDKQA